MSENRKVVVITGVSRGLGRAMAEEFVERGYLVAGCGRSRREIGELRARYSKRHLFAEVDVLDLPGVEAWASSVLDRLGAPDLLLNNAALINRNAPLWEVDPAEFSAVIDVNIKGVFHVIRAFLPAMIRRRHGIVVNFSSGWGRSTSADVAPYCATKWAIEGLTQALAQELPPGMGAIPLNPGVIDTEMLRSCFGGSAEAYLKPQAWAKKAVPYLLSLTPQQSGRALTVPG